MVTSISNIACDAIAAAGIAVLIADTLLCRYCRCVLQIDDDDKHMHKLTSSVTGTMARMQAMAQSGSAKSGPMAARIAGAGGRVSSMKNAFAVSQCCLWAYP